MLISSLLRILTLLNYLWICYGEFSCRKQELQKETLKKNGFKILI